MAKAPSTRTYTPVGRLSFPRLDKPDLPPGAAGDPKYSATLLIPADSPQLPAFRHECEKLLAEAGVPENKRGVFIDQILRDGNEIAAEMAEKTGKDITAFDCLGCVVLKSKTKMKPDVVKRVRGPDGKPTNVPVFDVTTEPYSRPGCKARFAVTLKFVATPMGKFLVSYLRGVQLLGGEPFTSQATEFDDDGLTDSEVIDEDVPF